MGELTMEQVRDRVAVLMGWKQPGASPAGSGISCHRWWRVLNAELRQYESTNHPIPSSLDGIAALWPKGWTWRRNDRGWIAFRDGYAGPIPGDPRTEDTDDELTDRTRLLLAVLEAQQKGDDNAK